MIGTWTCSRKPSNGRTLKVEVAVIEWKSIKAADRDKIIGRLGELGLDYERV